MKRYPEIDIIKGIAVLCMITFHFFYFPNQYGFKEIEYDTTTLKTIAKVAQIIFITSVGINMAFSYLNSKNDKKYRKKQIYRVMKISIYALLMSIFTYYVFKEKYVKFGILHFIAVSSLLLFMFIGNKNIIKLIILLIGILYFLKIHHQELFYIVPEKIAFISGFYNFKYASIDHFSLVPWMALICIGILIGHYINENPFQSSNTLTNNPISKFLETTGKHSLEIYALHWIVLYFIFCIVYAKYKKISISA